MSPSGGDCTAAGRPAVAADGLVASDRASRGEARPAPQAADNPDVGGHDGVIAGLRASRPIADAHATVAPLPGSRDDPFDAGMLVRLLAHELRTPLHVLRGFTEILLGGDAGGIPEHAAAALREIAAASRLLDVTLATLGDVAAVAASWRAGSPIAADLVLHLQHVGFVLDRRSTVVRCPIVTDPRLLEAGLRAARRWLERGAAVTAAATARLTLADDGAVRAVLGGAWRDDEVADLGGLDRLLAEVALGETGGRLSEENPDLVVQWAPLGRAQAADRAADRELCA